MRNAIKIFCIYKRGLTLSRAVSSTANSSQDMTFATNSFHIFIYFIHSIYLMKYFFLNVMTAIGKFMF